MAEMGSRQWVHDSMLGSAYQDDEPTSEWHLLEVGFGCRACILEGEPGRPVNLYMEGEAIDDYATVDDAVDAAESILGIGERGSGMDSEKFLYWVESLAMGEDEGFTEQTKVAFIAKAKELILQEKRLGRTQEQKTYGTDGARERARARGLREGAEEEATSDAVARRESGASAGSTRRDGVAGADRPY
jgi:hypothetical protein